MKLQCEIIEARNCGDCIELTVQARVDKASWRSIEKQTFRVDDTTQNRRAFYLGRQVSIRIKPL